MKYKSFFFIVIFFHFVMFGNVSGKNDFEQKIADGTVNWSTRTLYITGGGVAEINGSDLISARLSAERSAIKNSIERAEEAIQTILINRKLSIKDFTENSSKIRTGLERHIRKSQPESSRYFSDGSVEFIFAIPFEVFLESVLSDFRKNEVSKKEENETGDKSLKRIELDSSDNNTKEVLVIKFGKQNFLPQLSPTVIGHDSVIIYDVASQTLEKSGNGAVFYASKSAQEFLAGLDKKGKELVVSVSSVKNDNTVVLNKEATEKIKKELAPDALKNGNVIFLFP